jgi:hypothetical protein
MGRNRQKAIFDGSALCERRSGSLQICVLAVVWALLSLTLFPERFYGYPYEMVVHGFSVLSRIHMFGSPILLLRP